MDGSLFDFKAESIDGLEINLADYKDKAKAFLIVNVASACGLTDSNYKQLTEIYTELKPQGLEILAFPCNQFGAQEPKCNLDIKKFAKESYKVEFPMFSKIDVNGESSSALYNFLRSQGKVEKIPWNFSKFLLDRNGKFVAFYPHNASPMSFKKDIEDLLQ